MQNISQLESARFYLEKAGEIIKRYKHVDDMDFLISDHRLLILKPSIRAIQCPSKVDDEVYKKIAAFDVHTFLRFRVIDDPESLKLTLIVSDIMYKETRIFCRQLNSINISETKVNDSTFWWNLDRASLNEETDIDALEKSNHVCVCGICPRCIWRSAISKYSITNADVGKVKKALDNCRSIDDFLRFIETQE